MRKQKARSGQRDRGGQERKRTSRSERNQRKAEREEEKRYLAGLSDSEKRLRELQRQVANAEKAEQQFERGGKRRGKDRRGQRKFLSDRVMREAMEAGAISSKGQIDRK